METFNGHGNDIIGTLRPQSRASDYRIAGGLLFIDTSFQVSAGGLQQTPRTKCLFSKVVICANWPTLRSVSVEGATGKVALLM